MNFIVSYPFIPLVLHGVEAAVILTATFVVESNLNVIEKPSLNYGVEIFVRVVAFCVGVKSNIWADILNKYEL